MARAARNVRNDRRFRGLAATLTLLLLPACDGAHSKSGPAGSAPPRAETSPVAASGTTPAASSAAPPAAPFVPVKVAVSEEAMGTSLQFVTFTTPELDE